VHLLMNHSIPGVNAGYITRNKLLRDHLRVQQEAISRKMIDAARGTKQNEGQATALWIDTPGQGSQRACKRS
jgi:predicted amino acid dehydrogenase